MQHVKHWFIAAAALTSLLQARAAHAQATMTIAGRVTASGQPLGGTQVGIVELAAGAVTDQQGRYSFSIDPARASKPVSLLVRSIGYRVVQCAGAWCCSRDCFAAHILCRRGASTTDVRVGEQAMPSTTRLTERQCSGRMHVAGTYVGALF